MSISDLEAKQLLKEQIDNGLGISGHRVNNGADYYYCSSCETLTGTMGYSNLQGCFHDVRHKPDCALAKLKDWANT